MAYFRKKKRRIILISLPTAMPVAETGETASLMHCLQGLPAFIAYRCKFLPSRIEASPVCRTFARRRVGQLQRRGQCDFQDRLLFAKYRLDNLLDPLTAYPREYCRGENRLREIHIETETDSESDMDREKRKRGRRSRKETDRQMPGGERNMWNWDDMQNWEGLLPVKPS